MKRRIGIWTTFILSAGISVIVLLYNLANTMPLWFMLIWLIIYCVSIIGMGSPENT